jgi:hypothetical protein
VVVRHTTEIALLRLSNLLVAFSIFLPPARRSVRRTPEMAAHFINAGQASAPVREISVRRDPHRRGAENTAFRRVIADYPSSGTIPDLGKRSGFVLVCPSSAATLLQVTRSNQTNMPLARCRRLFFADHQPGPEPG